MNIEDINITVADPTDSPPSDLVTLLWDFIENGKSSYGLDFFDLRVMVREHFEEAS